MVSERQHRRWTHFLRRIISEGIEAGEFVALDPAMTATQVAALIDGLAVQAAMGNPALGVSQMRHLCLDALRRLLPCLPDRELGTERALLLPKVDEVDGKC